MGLGHLLHLPVISVGYDQAAPSGANKLFEQDRYPCPHFLFELHSVQDTADFFMQNPSIMKKLNLAHFVVILKQVSFMLVLQQLIGYLLFKNICTPGLAFSSVADGSAIVNSTILS